MRADIADAAPAGLAGPGRQTSLVTEAMGYLGGVIILVAWCRRFRAVGL